MERPWGKVGRVSWWWSIVFVFLFGEYQLHNSIHDSIKIISKKKVGAIMRRVIFLRAPHNLKKMKKDPVNEEIKELEQSLNDTSSLMVKKMINERLTELKKMK